MELGRRLIAIAIYVIGSATFFLYIAMAESQSTAVTRALQAIKAGDVKLALRLLDDVRDVNVDNAALFYEAVMHRQSEVIEKLFAKAADPNLRDDLLSTSLLNKWDSTTLLLLRHGANPNGHNPYGRLSPLSIASAQGNTAIMHALIDKGADVDYNDYVGSGTPLTIAIEENKLSAVQVLLNNAADPSIGAKFTGYPWDIAKNAKNKKILDLLMRYRSNCKSEPQRCM